MTNPRLARLRKWAKEADVQYLNRVRGSTSKADELYEIARLWANGTTGEIRENAHALFLLELRETCNKIEKQATLKKNGMVK